MIQRIQSVFLFLAAGLLSGQFFVPYYTISPQTVGLPPSLTDGALTPTDNIGTLGLTILSAGLALVAIFLFKNRKLQMTISNLAMVVAIMLLALFGMVYYQTTAVVNDPSGHTGFGWALLVLALVALFLATRGIRKDENLVRSMDRLR
jgi:hypothetical protein